MTDFLKNIQIQKLVKSDLKYLSDLTPDGWGDITLVYQMHIDQSYFSPIKLVYEDKIIGVAELIVNKKIGWLGNIVVDKKFRKQGLGKILTEHLVEMAMQKKCESIYLLATPMGKSVYQKLGFQENGKYLFFKNAKELPSVGFCNNIFTYQLKHKDEILKLDQEAMGEDRSEVLIHHLEGSFVYKKPEEKNICGFYLPTLTNGLIICNNQLAGFELIQKRESLGEKTIVVPEQCEATIQFLQQRNYVEYRQATFMFLGKMKKWNPLMVYSRVGGYLG